MKHLWVEEFPAAITVCNSKGIILEMNDRAVRAFHEQGGKKLIGKNLLDCHPEYARAKLRQLMEARQRNVYTIQKRVCQEANLPIALVQRRQIFRLC